MNFFKNFNFEIKHLFIKSIKGVIYTWSFFQMHFQNTIHCVRPFFNFVDFLWNKPKGKREFQTHDLEFLQNGKVVKTAFLSDYLDTITDEKKKEINYDCVVYTKNKSEKYVQLNPHDLNQTQPPKELSNMFVLCELVFETNSQVEDKDIYFETEEYNYLFEKNVFCHSFFVYFMKKHYHMDISQHEYLLSCFKNHTLKKLNVSKENGFILGDE
jgi:hypothetical protein